MKDTTQTGGTVECEHPDDGVMWNPWNEAVQCHRCGHVVEVDWAEEAYRLAEAIRITQEYVGHQTLPSIPGWSWFDGLERYYRLSGLRPTPAVLPVSDDVPQSGRYVQSKEES